MDTAPNSTHNPLISPQQIDSLVNIHSALLALQLITECDVDLLKAPGVMPGWGLLLECVSEAVRFEVDCQGDS